LLDDLPGVLQMAPVDDSIGALAALALLAGTTRVALTSGARIRLHRRLRRMCREFGGGELVVLPDDEPQAFAVPGRPGHVVVTDAMLRVLTVPQRRVLFAHERAHLARRHGRLLATTETAAAMNPMLAPVRRAVAFLCERWADEDAAEAVGDRRLAAQALATAALATTAAGRAPAADLAFHELSVVRRVAALRSPTAPVRYWRLIVTVPMLLCAVTLAADLNATAQFIELAGRLAHHH
jgi:Zn-dependent protease with chaperone function